MLLRLLLLATTWNLVIPPLGNAILHVDYHGMLDTGSLPFLGLPHPTNMLDACPKEEKVGYVHFHELDMISTLGELG